MRIPILILTLAVLFVAVHSLARGADEEGTDVEALQRRVQVLEHQVAYLLSRETDTTAWILGREALGVEAAKVADEAERLGFTRGAIPTSSREAILGGLRALGEALQEKLPEVTKEQKDLLLQAQRAR